MQSCTSKQLSSFSGGAKGLEFRLGNSRLVFEVPPAGMQAADTSEETVGIFLQLNCSTEQYLIRK